MNELIAGLKYVYRGHKEGDPGHHDEHGGGEVHGQDEGAQRPWEANFKPVHAVIAWTFPEWSLRQYLMISYLRIQQTRSYALEASWYPHWKTRFSDSLSNMRTSRRVSCAENHNQLKLFKLKVYTAHRKILFYLYIFT